MFQIQFNTLYATCQGKNDKKVKNFFAQNHAKFVPKKPCKMCAKNDHANFVPKMKKSKIPVPYTPEIVQNLWKS